MPLICSFPSLHYNGADRMHSRALVLAGFYLGLATKTLVRDEGSSRVLSTPATPPQMVSPEMAVSSSSGSSSHQAVVTAIALL